MVPCLDRDMPIWHLASEAAYGSFGHERIKRVWQAVSASLIYQYIIKPRVLILVLQLSSLYCISLGYSITVHD